jgi:predicted ATPase/DNA-binding winged helix-turn-helix (wHTH) protein
MLPASVAPAAIEFGRFRALPHRRELLADNRPVELGGRAFDVLMALIEARGAVISKDALIERVWPGRIVEENNLQVQISVLRKVFAADRGLIRTVSGRGYQFAGEIRTISALADREKAVGTPEAAPTPSRSSTNLPERVSELIGREIELAEILDLSAAHRLVTLTGAGGIGKTRLGFEVARHQLPRFADGVWAIELAPLSDPDLVPVTIATALGLELASGTASPQSVANALRSKQLMVVLDNCEHVVDAVAQMAESLLRANQTMRVIATSREPLQTEGEWIYPVPPLAVPPEGSPESKDALRYGAVRLFHERARAAVANLSSDARTASAIAGICRRLDGIPLAIELAAARAGSLGVEGLAAGLDDLFRLLTRGRRTALPHHQTLRGTLDWSYALLTEPERVVLRRLAIFAGGFTLQAAVAVVGDHEVTEQAIVNGVANLVMKSLVSTDGGVTVRRHRLLETTRAYALEKLAEAGEFDTVARRHADRYLDLFEGAEAEAGTRPTDEWLADYVPRIDNLRAALDWAFSPHGDASIGIALTAAAVPLWMHLSLLDECRTRAEQGLAACNTADGGDPRREMKLYTALATSSHWGSPGVFQVVVRKEGAILTKALEIAERLDDAEYRLRLLWSLFALHIGNGEFQIALEMAQRFRTFAAQQQRQNDELIGERLLGCVRHVLGDQVSARRHIGHMLANFVQSNQRSHEAIRFQSDQRVAACNYLARILWLQGFPDEATRTAKDAVDEACEINHAVSLCYALAHAACSIMLWVGDLAAAERYIVMLLDHSTRHTLPSWGALGRTFQGVLAIRRGDVDRGLSQLQVGLHEFGAMPYWMSMMFPNELAAGFARAGQITDGLAAVEQAIEGAERTEARWLFPESLRIKGELLLLQAATGAAAAAQYHFRQALDWARRQGALSLELRAATSHARLLRDRGNSADARALLQSVYDRFTDGFATADLKAAKALLDDLS